MGWANEKLHVAEYPQGNQGTAAFIGTQAQVIHMHWQPGNARREWHYQIMVARLTLVFIVRLRPVPKAWPTLERLAVDSAPALLGVQPRCLVEPVPFDAGLVEVILQLVITFTCEDSTCFL